MTTLTATPLLLDEQLPRYDRSIAAHRIVDADPQTVLDAARNLDFMAVHTPLMDAATWARTLPARLRRRFVPPPPQIRLTAGGLPGWEILGERPGEEIAFGAIGVFWRGEIRWAPVPPANFASFATPGFGKIACSFSVRPYGRDRTLLTFDCRVATTDERSRQAFARYWMVIRPFVGHIMRAAVATIAADATGVLTMNEPGPAGS
jgi:hypothetical protein